MTVDIILYFDSTRLLLPYHPPTNFKDNFRHEFRILKLSKSGFNTVLTQKWFQHTVLTQNSGSTFSSKNSVLTQQCFQTSVDLSTTIEDGFIMQDFIKESKYIKERT
ncbi:hypothetical protein HanLR1_Chr11g0388651 [Helianthus annuus]|nr:hypothetical protein HanLR1_Chr11g0388651 [Helianthus annuus]